MFGAQQLDQIGRLLGRIHRGQAISGVATCGECVEEQLRFVRVLLLWMSVVAECCV